MVLVFLAVDGLTTISLGEEVGIKGTVQNFSIHFCVSISLVADDLEEGGATTARLSQDQDHLTGLYDTLEILEDIKLGAFLSKAKNAGGCLKDIEKGYE